MIRQIQKILVVAMLGLFASSAFADFEQCIDPTGSSGSGGGNGGSAIETTDGDMVDATDCGPYTGNDNEDAVSGLYGTADWGKLTRLEDPAGGGTSGSYTYANSGGYKSLLVVLKFDGLWSAFKVKTGNTAGTSLNINWSTDCDTATTAVSLCSGDGKFGNSHITVYAGDAPLVPAPATLLLFGAALAGFGISRRRLVKA
jgi:hypothetical protein